MDWDLTIYSVFFLTDFFSICHDIEIMIFLEERTNI